MKLSIAGVLAALLVIAGCSTSPPKPPKCDGSDRRPVNTSSQAAALAPAVDTCSRG
jgi:hypothetical protein